MAQALIVIDAQNEYFAGGAMQLPDVDAAGARIAAAIAAARAAGLPLLHIRHEELESDEWGFVPGTPGAQINPVAAPAAGEPVILKHAPNSFAGTDLLERLRALDVDAVALCGFMTSMCVDSTARAAGDLGLAVTVLGDACAAPPLEHAGRTVSAEDVNAAFLGALAQGLAEVVDVEAFSAALV